jgi:AcrR family transcriptional regulator
MSRLSFMASSRDAEKRQRVIAAGMSRPALYLVFSQKQEVFRAVVRDLARAASDDVHQGLGAIKSPRDQLRFICEVWMVRPFDWITLSPETREVYESSHAFAQDVVEESLASFERDLTSVLARRPKGALPRGISPAHAARLLASGIIGLKARCRDAAELRDEIHALITTMIRV